METNNSLQIPEELDNFRCSLSELDDLIETLSKRLYIILRGDNCTSNNLKEVEADKNRVPLASDINILICRLKESNEYLKNILFRLEV